MRDIIERFGLARVINAAGWMTALGSSRTDPVAARLASEIQSHFVRIDELQAVASQAISEATGAEAGVVVGCSASGISCSVSACMTGLDLGIVEQLPATDNIKNEVAMMRGHRVSFGANVDQVIQLTGAKIVEFGGATQAERYQLEHAIGDKTAAAFFMVSHHTVQDGQIPMEGFIASCHERKVPVIVDMASEYDLTGPIAKGADLVIYSAHKFLSGLTGGIVAGRKDLVQAVHLQSRGIGRTMKAGKESIVSAVGALKSWKRRSSDAVPDEERRRLSFWADNLRGLDGVEVDIFQDWTGNALERLILRIDPKIAKLHAWNLVDELQRGETVVYTREDHLEHEIVLLDPCNVSDQEAKIVAGMITEVLTRAKAKSVPRESWAERKDRSQRGAADWPDKHLERISRRSAKT